MKQKLKKYIRPILFTAGGAAAGLAYYCFVGCDAASCPITSNPVVTMIYMSVIGFLLSTVFEKEDKDKCNM